MLIGSCCTACVLQRLGWLPLFFARDGDDERSLAADPPRRRGGERGRAYRARREEGRGPEKRDACGAPHLQRRLLGPLVCVPSHVPADDRAVPPSVPRARGFAPSSALHLWNDASFDGAGTSASARSARSATGNPRSPRTNPSARSTSRAASSDRPRHEDNSLGSAVGSSSRSPTLRARREHGPSPRPRRQLHRARCLD